jgi:sugar lactone lactonase YvrE
VVRFSPDQLTASGNPVPRIGLKADANKSLFAPVGLAFDAQGSLWVSNSGGPTVVKFAPEQLATTGNPTPAVTITGTVAVVGGAGPSLSKPHGLAFDKDGGLWVANLSADTLVRYSPQQLSTSGSPTPAVTIKSDNLKGPAGLAFDNQGSLWVTNATSHALVRLPASDLVTTATIAGVVAVANLGANEVALPAFSPAPANLPINQ